MRNWRPSARREAGTAPILDDPPQEIKENAEEFAVNGGADDGDPKPGA